ncbi:MAG: DUF1702 family protein [Planctomycetota bacterium]
MVKLTSAMGGLRRRLLGIDVRETSCERRGFAVANPQMRARLEHIGATFVAGYHLALEARDVATLNAALTDVELEARGWAYEGAGLGLVLRDRLALLRRRGRTHFAEFVGGLGAAHSYLLHVGAGWLLGKLPLRVDRYARRFDPIGRWLVVDGYGFESGYFHWRRDWQSGDRNYPARLPRTGYYAHAFDQGLGRSLWFVQGADPQAIRDSIELFAAPRRSDLWSGVGLACGYAGGVTRAELTQLLQLVGSLAPALAQGVVFAAAARARAENPSPATELACATICGFDVARAVAIANESERASRDVPDNFDCPAYEVWRRRVQAHFATVRGAA